MKTMYQKIGVVHMKDFTEFIPTSEKYWIESLIIIYFYYNLSRKIEMIV